MCTYNDIFCVTCLSAMLVLLTCTQDELTKNVEVCDMISYYVQHECDMLWKQAVNFFSCIRNVVIAEKICTCIEA